MPGKKNAKVAQKTKQKQPVNEKYKDRIFKSLFGNSEHKDWTLALYNAVNNSHYRNPENIQFNTIDDALFVGLQNDVSFLIAFELNLWEQLMQTADQCLEKKTTLHSISEMRH